MNDSIKIFIQENRAAFDTALPGAQGWSEMQRLLDRLPQTDGLERAILSNRLLLDTAWPAEHVWANITADMDARRPADPLENFIRVNRADFDMAVPDLKIWGSLESSLPAARQTAKKVIVHWQRTLLRAAAAIALLITGVGAGIWYANSAAARQAGMAMGDVSTEYHELEQYYQRGIASQQQELATFTGNESGDVYADLEQMDLAMNELRAELANVPAGNREQVVRAMIENYKAKMAILQRVLERLEQTKTDQNDTKHHERKSI